MRRTQLFQLMFKEALYQKYTNHMKEQSLWMRLSYSYANENKLRDGLKKLIHQT